MLDSFITAVEGKHDMVHVPIICVHVTWKMHEAMPFQFYKIWKSDVQCKIIHTVLNFFSDGLFWLLWNCLKYRDSMSVLNDWKKLMPNNSDIMPHNDSVCVQINNRNGPTFYKFWCSRNRQTSMRSELPNDRYLMEIWASSWDYGTYHIGDQWTHDVWK